MCKHGNMFSILVLISQGTLLFLIYIIMLIVWYIFKMVVLMLCGDTPVLISNTEVKPTGGDGTAGLYWWESS